MGFNFDKEADLIKSRKDLKKRMADFKLAIRTKYIRVNFEKVEFSEGMDALVTIRCRLILDCSDDPYLNHYHRDFHNNADRKFLGCSPNSIYYNADYIELIKSKVVEIFGQGSVAEFSTYVGCVTFTLYIANIDFKSKEPVIEHAVPENIQSISKTAPPPPSKNYGINRRRLNRRFRR
jgi:hypothetical protein